MGTPALTNVENCLEERTRSFEAIFFMAQYSAQSLVLLSVCVQFTKTVPRFLPSAT
jgi:hypothetical protein